MYTFHLHSMTAFKYLCFIYIPIYFFCLYSHILFNCYLFVYFIHAKKKPFNAFMFPILCYHIHAYNSTHFFVFFLFHAYLYNMHYCYRCFLFYSIQTHLLLYSPLTTLPVFALMATKTKHIKKGNKNFSGINVGIYFSPCNKSDSNSQKRKCI